MFENLKIGISGIILVRQQTDIGIIISLSVGFMITYIISYRGSNYLLKSITFLIQCIFFNISFAFQIKWQILIFLDLLFVFAFLLFRNSDILERKYTLQYIQKLQKDQQIKDFLNHVENSQSNVIIYPQNNQLIVESLNQSNFKIQNLTELVNFFQTLQITIQENSQSQRKEYPEDITKYLKKCLYETNKNSFENNQVFYYKNKDFSLIKVQFFQIEWNHKQSILIKILDLSQDNEIRQLKNEIRVKDSMLSCMSHELKTPVNGLIYFIGTIPEQKSQQKLLNLCNAMNSNCHWLLNLIKGILDYGQLQNGQLKIQNQRFRLGQVIEEAKELMNIFTSQKDIKIVQKIRIKSNQQISDFNRIKQVIINLISNSNKFTTKGIISIEIFEYQQANLIQISIKDTGIGIKPDIIPKLQQPYQTFDQNQLNKDGIGLGLYICKNIVTALGPCQQINITSKVGEGSCFSFLIYNDNNVPQDKQKFKNNSIKDSQYDKIIKKLRVQEQNPNMDQISFQSSSNIDRIDQPMETITLLPQDGRCFHILICDDQIFNAHCLEAELIKQFQQFEFIIEKVVNGYDAINYFKQFNDPQNQTNNKIDIIFCDIKMPIFNGYATTQQIRLLIDDDNYKPCKIFAFTADTNFNADTRYFDGFVEKPPQKITLNNLFQSMIQ